MRIETLCTGDELLTGLTLDSNGAFLQASLLECLGLRVSRSTVVGDEEEEMVKALVEASARAKLLVVSGGLGPTADDITVACAAKAAELPLVFSAEIFQSIEARAQSLGFRLTEAAKKQAWVPRGARYVLNKRGSAPMVQLRIGACEVFLLPGVPCEFRAFVEEELLKHVEERCLEEGGPVFRRLRRLQCMGLPESLVEEALAGVVAAFPEAKIGFRVHSPAVEVKLLCEGQTAEALAQLEAAVVSKAKEALGLAVFAEGEASLGECIAALLLERGQTLGVAESCTGGQLAAALTAVAGASQCFKGGAVVYTGEAKRLWGGLSEEFLKTHGEVSAETTRWLAHNIRGQLGTDWGLAVTGYAGPTGEAGLFFLACAGPGLLREAKIFWPGTRKEVQVLAAARALELLRRCLLELPIS
ncbi:MAG: CinA family nicotinamide mononucleotide deamidase-related protein [Cystobacterineae bacterium]|nr:CinA family nicotinamide mononucleotide deamidase-related protein [Cystobacterineae bacterium]